MALTRLGNEAIKNSLTNIVDQGTEGTKVATGTTGQRGSTTGQWRYNSTTGKFEGRNASTFVELNLAPTVTSVDDGEVDSAGGGNQTIVITGTGFTSGSIASFVGSSASFDAATTTINSATQITAVAPKASFLNAQEPYKVKVTAANGLAGTSASGLINVDNAPTWTTGSGTVATILDSATGTHATLAASDAEGDTVAYTETGATNLASAGFSLNSSTGAITGDPNNVTASTTVSFTGRATAGGKTADRSFNIIVNPPLAWDILGGIDNQDGDALNTAATGLQIFIDPADTNSYSGSGTSVTNRAYSGGSPYSGASTFTMTDLTLAGSGGGKYFLSGSSTNHLVGSGNSTVHWSNDSTDGLAYCGWWYVKNELDNSSNTLWCVNDGDWSPMGQMGIRMQDAKFRALRGNSTNIQEPLPSLTYTDKWMFISHFAQSSIGMLMNIAFADDTNLTDVYNNSSYSFTTGTGNSYPFTFGARPDTLSQDNPQGTRMGFQAAWMGFVGTSNGTLAGIKANFESIFDQTKGNYA
tara:strand:+ start:20844 stop:22424 length:1581 start_codon:yes stop_codon:yes gene_type:complete